MFYLRYVFISSNLSKFEQFAGSFIHAGHGDINAEQSWGQPDYIDDIYLKNPILRKEESAYEKSFYLITSSQLTLYLACSKSYYVIIVLYDVILFFFFSSEVARNILDQK